MGIARIVDGREGVADDVVSNDGDGRGNDHGRFQRGISPLLHRRQDRGLALGRMLVLSGPFGLVKSE